MSFKFTMYDMERERAILVFYTLENGNLNIAIMKHWGKRKCIMEQFSSNFPNKTIFL